MDHGLQKHELQKAAVGGTEEVVNDFGTWGRAKIKYARKERLRKL